MRYPPLKATAQCLWVLRLHSRSLEAYRSVAMIAGNIGEIILRERVWGLSFKIVSRWNIVEK